MRSFKVPKVNSSTLRFMDVATVEAACDERCRYFEAKEREHGSAGMWLASGGAKAEREADQLNAEMGLLSDHLRALKSGAVTPEAPWEMVFPTGGGGQRSGAAFGVTPGWKAGHWSDPLVRKLAQDDPHTKALL